MGVESFVRDLENLAATPPKTPKSSSTLTLDIPLALSQTLSVTGAQTFTGNQALTGNQTIGGTLAVTGLITATAGLVNGSVQNAITAFATGGQTNAVALVVGMNRITVCATSGDSVLLPAATAGRTVSLANAGAAAAAVFPNGASDVIQGIATTTAMLLASGSSIEYRCVVAGTWSVFNNALLDSSWSTGALQSTTFPAGALTGGGDVTYTNTGTTPASLATRTATQMFADTPNAQVGMTYKLTVINLSGSANTATITAGSGVTLTGTATIAQNIARVYQVTFTSATALVMQEMYSFTAAA